MPHSVPDLAQEILFRQSQTNSDECFVIGISGIDGCGKGFIARKIHQLLKEKGRSVALIHIDGWLNLPRIRFSSVRPAEHFYEHAIRFDSLFSQLILPLKKQKSIDLLADYTEETASEYRKEHYRFTSVDLMIVEGIYLFKKAFLDYFDMKIWIDCTFKTALERAIERGQEKLSASDTLRAYQQIYFPAQEIHLKKDSPQASADLRIVNDHRL